MMMSKSLSTEELSRLVKVKPTSIRSALSTHGHYYGITPTKLPNGRLLWPYEQVEVLLKGGQQ